MTYFVGELMKEAARASIVTQWQTGQTVYALSVTSVLMPIASRISWSLADRHRLVVTLLIAADHLLAHA